MNTIPHYLCGVIPPHMLSRIARQRAGDAPEDARATLEHMRELATDRAHTLIERHPGAPADAPKPRRRRNVYDAQHRHHLPGKLVMSAHKARSSDVEVNEAYDGSGATLDFLAAVFGRKSIDDKGMRLDATVHYGTRFTNALWNGRQMVYGDGDGRVFTRFTASVDVIAHELTHGVTQFSAGLGYTGQTGALNEHLSDAFGVMVKHYQLDHPAHEGEWVIGAELFGPGVNAKGVRSMAVPGAAYDDPLLGCDPQPSHMRDYVQTVHDNGGVHINSGILNHAFYPAATAIGGKTWEVLGKIWYAALTQRLKPEADFNDFAKATVDIAGELFGNGGHIQRVIVDAWTAVGLRVPFLAFEPHRNRPRRERAHAAPAVALPKWRQRPAR